MAPQGTIVLTGANGGLGSHIVAQILRQPTIAKSYHGVYTVRKVEAADKVKKFLNKAPSTQHSHELLALDLSSLASVRQTAGYINKRVAEGSLPPIRALILNAAFQEWATQSFTDDGFDMTFQATYLSHFLLTLLLLQSMDKEHGRIVVLGSWSHDTTDSRNTMGPKPYVDEKYKQIFTEPLDTEPIARGKWSSASEHPDQTVAGFRRYGAAKLCEVMMFRELSARLSNDPQLSGISVLAVDPGAMSSNLSRRGPWFQTIMLSYFMPVLAVVMTWLMPNGDVRTLWKSGRDVVRAAFDTKTLGSRPNGLYLNGSAVSAPGPEAKDSKKSGRLWSDSLGYAGIKEGDTVLMEWR